jgi:Fe-S oxidoreductase
MSESLIVPTMAEMVAQGKQPEVLFWVGRQEVLMIDKKDNKAFVRILNRADVPFAVLVLKKVLVDPAKEQKERVLVSNTTMMNIEVLKHMKQKK